MNCKSLHPSDYADLQRGVEIISYGLAWLRGKGLRVDWPHPHRMWEYASAAQAVLETPKPITTVLDVGAGYSVLGPALALRWGYEIIELDNDPKIVEARGEVSEALAAKSLKHTMAFGEATDEHPKADAVFCISVLEHLYAIEQEQAWQALAAAVNPGGVLVATVDYGDTTTEWSNSDQRYTRYGLPEVKKAIATLTAAGLDVADLDETFHGNHVGLGESDYTFFRIIARRPEIISWSEIE
jgi:SAM-dependent methyltransferase